MQWLKPGASAVIILALAGCGEDSDSPSSPSGAFFEGAYELALAPPGSGSSCLSRPGSVVVTASESNRIVLLSAPGQRDFLRIDYEPTGSGGEITNVFLHLFMESLDLGGQLLTGSYEDEEPVRVTLANGRGQVQGGRLRNMVSGCRLLWSLTPR